MVPASAQEPDQCLKTLAFANGWNLAITLMVCVVVFHADAGNFGVMLAAEYDGDPAAVIHEFDPLPTMKGANRHPSWTAERPAGFPLPSGACLGL